MKKSAMSMLFHTTIPEVVDVLYARGGLTNRQIAHRIECDESGLSKQLRLMEVKGMTRRNNGKWYLTKEGRELAPYILGLRDKMETTLNKDAIGNWHDFLVKYNWTCIKEDQPMEEQSTV